MWISDYMAREGIDAAELAVRAREYDRMANGKVEGRITGALIEMLIVGKGNGFTHPRFADAIAAVCGATSAQRDMIVAERRRGRWRPTKEVREMARKAVKRAAARRVGVPVYVLPEVPPPPEISIGPVATAAATTGANHGCKPVTVIGPDGTATHYPSIIAAAAAMELWPGTVSKLLRRHGRDNKGRLYVHSVKREKITDAAGG